MTVLNILLLPGLALFTVYLFGFLESVLRRNLEGIFLGWPVDRIVAFIGSVWLLIKLQLLLSIGALLAKRFSVFKRNLLCAVALFFFTIHEFAKYFYLPPILGCGQVAVRAAGRPAVVVQGVPPLHQDEVRAKVSAALSLLSPSAA